MGGHYQDRHPQAGLHAREEAGKLYVRRYIGGETVRERRAIPYGGTRAVQQDVGGGVWKGHGAFE